jgi:hypothetical protein
LISRRPISAPSDEGLPCWPVGLPPIHQILQPGRAAPERFRAAIGLVDPWEVARCERRQSRIWHYQPRGLAGARWTEGVTLTPDETDRLARIREFVECQADRLSRTGEGVLHEGPERWSVKYSWSDDVTP